VLGIGDVFLLGQGHGPQAWPDIEPGASLRIRDAGFFALLSGTILATPAVADEARDTISVVTRA